MNKFLRFLSVIVLCGVLVVVVRAAGTAMDAAVFTVDLPFDAAQPLPVWMHGPPISASGSGARVAFQLSPPQSKDLLLHLVFDEADGGGLRVDWLRDGQSVPEALAENLSEGTGILNQRTLLVSASRMGGNGTLLLQGSSTLNVSRVRFEWVSEQTMLASSARYVPVVVTASRLTLAEADVDGKPRPMLQDEWRGKVVRAPLTERVEQLTPAIEFQAVLGETPMQARLELAVSGVFLDQEVWVLVNNNEIGPLAIDVPTLADSGYVANKRGGLNADYDYAGWRQASVYIPSGMMMPGENSVVLELRSPTNAGYRNRTLVREVVLELVYPPPMAEPNLALPIADLPEDDAEIMEEPPLPPVMDAVDVGTPADALSDFWGSGGGGAL